LAESNNLQVYVPKGCAHGFQTLTDDVLVAYHISEFYDSEKAGGIRWDDREIGITWPLKPTVQSERDLSLPLLENLDTAVLMPFAGNP
jgi:dTDP-4-dehydrorhamnose 3,5-epimerase